MTFSTSATRRGALMACAATPALILSLTFAGAASAQTADVAQVADVVVTAAGFEQRIAQETGWNLRADRDVGLPLEQCLRSAAKYRLGELDARAWALVAEARQAGE